MKKTTKKVIALTAVLAMAASTSTMAFAESPYSDDVQDTKSQVEFIANCPSVAEKYAGTEMFNFNFEIQRIGLVID